MKFVKLLLALSIALNLILGTLLVLGAIKVSQFGAMGAAGAQGGPPPVAVSTGVAEADEWEVSLRSVGSVDAVEGITIRTEVAGVVERITFEPGRMVEAGTVLVELDRSVEEANLAQARAELDLAQRTLRRTADLFETRSVPEADLDSARSQVAAVEARVAALEAALAKKTIRAPFAGRLGIKQISAGQYLTPGEAVVALQALDPVYVEFSLPQRHLGLLEEGYLVRARTDAYPDQVFTGTLTAIDPEVDPETRNVRLQATFENPESRLLPGIFADVAVIMPERRSVVMVPTSSIVFAPYGNRLFLVEEDGETLTVSPTIVRLGETRGDFIEVEEGVTAGTRIVTDGAFKLREGASIQVSDQGTVEPELDPRPANT